MNNKSLIIFGAIGLLFVGTVFFSGCASLMEHTECNEDNQCIVVNDSFGTDQCETDDDCMHYECTEDNKCELVDGPGDDICEDDSECVDEEVNETHMECSEGVCEEVDGEGTDGCTVEDQDTECYHMICDYDTETCGSEYIEVDGDACEEDSECVVEVETYLACEEGACVEVEGSETDECTVEDQDTECYHMICDYDTETCGSEYIEVDGDACEEDSECVETCVPDCEGLECGDDGCGGSCGTCEEGYECVEGICESTGTGNETNGTI